MISRSETFIEAGVHRVRIYDHGSGEPLVLVHGLTGFIEDWAANLDALASRYRVIALDLPGSGRSSMPPDGDYSQDGITASLLKVLDTLNIERAHLAGYSSGGRQALHLAALAPERVRSVMALAPAGFDYETIINFRLASVPLLGELLTRPNMAVSRMLMRTAVHYPAVLAQVYLDWKLALARAPGAQAVFLKTLRGMVGWRGFHPETVAVARSWLPQITVPVLVVWGRQDKFVAASHAEVLRAGLADVEVRYYEDCGHLPMLEHSARFNTDALTFLATRAA